MVRHAALLSRIERQFGVPPALIMAIWTLETDNGTGDMGKLPVVRTLATLAHDCRRTELFQRELIAALQIVQRGDLPLRDLVGAFAGEIGQTQFLPSSYIKYGVDYDGNGHVDLRHSVPDVLASTANLLKVNGWRAGEPFREGTANFEVMREWNRSEVYRKTMVLMAERIRGRGALILRRGAKRGVSLSRARTGEATPPSSSSPAWRRRGPALDLQRRAAGFLRDLAVLLDDEAARGFVLVQPAEELGRHAPVGALRAVLIDDVEEHEFAFGVGSRFLRHGSRPIEGAYSGAARYIARAEKEKPRASAGFSRSRQLDGLQIGGSGLAAARIGLQCRTRPSGLR